MKPSPFHCVQKRSDLVLAEYLDSMPLGSRQFDAALSVSRVECDPIQPDGLREGLVQHGVCLDHGACRKPAPAVRLG
ncbi:MAG: hypothetical protein ACYCX5_09495 [Coriobacteriia bacterium]